MAATGSDRPMRRLICSACRGRVPLVGLDVRCGCGRSAAKLGDDGWGYTGPCMVAIVAPAHEPGRRRIEERIVEIPDDDVSHRAVVDPLL